MYPYELTGHHEELVIDVHGLCPKRRRTYEYVAYLPTAERTAGLARSLIHEGVLTTHTVLTPWHDCPPGGCRDEMMKTTVNFISDVSQNPNENRHIGVTFVLGQPDHETVQRVAAAAHRLLVAKMEAAVEVAKMVRAVPRAP